MALSIPAGWPLHRMWGEVLPSVTDELRQGDLIRDVVIPEVSSPIHPQPNPVGKGYLTTLAAPTHLALVVSQCCQNEKGKYVSISPVVESRPIKRDELEAWLLAEPSPDGDYVYDCFCLEPLEGLIQHSSVFVAGGDEAMKLRIADLARATPFSGDWTGLREARVARMTPFGRYLLRTKLAFCWSRAEAEDAELLAALETPGTGSPASA